ncbi:MAG: hypothetical protein LWY06_02785 [Firmicutes bacterium]|nr:hypothetical protein [Bacillota bacterium]
MVYLCGIFSRLRKNPLSGFSLIFALAFLATVLFLPSPALAQQAKIRIAVIEFEQGRYHFDSDKMTYRVESSLIRDGGFDVVSGKKVKEAASELKLPDSGFMNQEDAVKIGQKVGADLVVMGEVTEFNVDRSSFSPGVSIGRVRVGRVYSVTVKLVLTSKMIAVHTGQQVFSESFEGNSHRESPDVGYSYVNISLDDPDPDSMAQKVQKEAMDKLTAKIKQSATGVKTAGPAKPDSASLNGYLLAVEKEQIITDLGKESKVTPGMSFSVYELKSWTHPQTGKKVTEKMKVAKIRIVRVNENTSVAELTEGAPSDIKAGLLIVQE